MEIGLQWRVGRELRSTKCSQNHNIRIGMNWLDFLDVLDCYRQQRVAACRFCKRCDECRNFKRLCAKAWGITLNSWKYVRSYVVAVRFNSMNQKYPKTLPMMVDILNKIIINVDEEKLYKEKEQKILYEKIINKYKRWSFFKFWNKLILLRKYFCLFHQFLVW